MIRYFSGITHSDWTRRSASVALSELFMSRLAQTIPAAVPILISADDLSRTATNYYAGFAHAQAGFC